MRTTLALLLILLATRAWGQPSVIQVNEQNSIRVTITGFTIDDGRTPFDTAFVTFLGVDVTLDFPTNPLQRMYAHHFDGADFTGAVGSRILTFTIPGSAVTMRPGPPQKAVLTYVWKWVDGPGVTQQGKKEDVITLVNLAIP